MAAEAIDASEDETGAEATNAAEDEITMAAEAADATATMIATEDECNTR